ncbi:hypothetical protein [Rubellimicrobium arenae]|uniref:hypothetical protein n=1 Tax=Rubellimicrobium arenae TaxID=2817372 RepID=UPI001B305593|nr:hypothetical protein [Rubellimicrobium arenae]
MTASTRLRRAAWAALIFLSACGGVQGDWRATFGKATPNPVILAPALPLVTPATLDLPAPGGVNRATPGR